MHDRRAPGAAVRETHQRIFGVISEVTGIAADELDSGMSIAEDIAPNSIDRITLFMALEDEFGESIPESEVSDIQTLGELLVFVERRIADARDTRQPPA